MYLYVYIYIHTYIYMCKHIYVFIYIRTDLQSRPTKEDAEEEKIDRGCIQNKADKGRICILHAPLKILYARP